jgi:hypothetical protein
VSREYLVGLPVVVTVSSTGTVTYSIDTSETSSAIWDDDECGYTPDHIEEDAQAIDRDHERRMRAAWPDRTVPEPSMPLFLEGTDNA